MMERAHRTSDKVKTAFARGHASGAQFAERHPRFLKVLIITLPLVLYALASCLFLRPPSLAALHNDVFNSSPDPQQFVWFLNWWPYALTHHLNPFITKFAWYPHGYNLAWDTSVPALAYIMAPVTLIGGAVLSFNLIALLGPPLSALACFYLIYRITKRFLPALIGGYIYGFSTFEMGQLAGHPQMYVNFLVPIIVLLCWRHVYQKTRAALFVSLTGILLALQFGISTEIFTTLIIFLTVAFVVFYLLQPEIRDKLAVLAKHFYGAVGVSLLLASPYLYYMVVGYNSVPGSLHPPDIFSADTLNFVVPTPITQLGGRLVLGLSQHFTGNYSEDGAYIGLPLLAILVYIAFKYWQRIYMRALVVLLVLIMLFALGPKLHIAGHTGHIGGIIGLPLPWIIPAHLPLLRSALPGRLTMYMFLVIAIIIGAWLSYKTSRRNQVVKYAAVLVGIACIVPAVSQYTWSYVPVPHVFRKSQVSKYIPQGSNVLILPYGPLGSDMYYQYASGMWFMQSGGYVGAAPTSYSGSPVLNALLEGTPRPRFGKELEQFCASNRVTKIVYLPQTNPAIVGAIHSLDWPTRTVHGAAIVSVPHIKST